MMITTRFWPALCGRGRLLGFSTLCCALLFACGQTTAPAGADEEALAAALASAGNGEPLTVFLVRHAEKKSGDDPELTAEGRARARRLARLLSGAALDDIYSTDYRRALSTARPTSASARVKIQIYDPRELGDFADYVKGEGGRALIVGHSNTTPELVVELGGDPGGPIDDATEFDRLYVVVELANGKVITTVHRY